MANRAQIVGVTGARGLLGSALLRASTPQIKFVPFEGDITKSDSFHAWPRADFVVNAAAKTNVDTCEDDPATAFEVNVEGVRKIVQWCKSQSLDESHARTPTLIQISSEMVFRPVNVYASSKEKANTIIETELPQNHMILCTSNLFGISETKKTFPHWVVEQLKQKKPFDVVSDFYCHPTWVEDVAEAIQWAVAGNYNGKLIVAGNEYVSKYEHARMIEQAWNGNAPTIIRKTEGKWEKARRESVNLHEQKLPRYKKMTPLQESTRLFVEEIKGKS